MSFGDRVAFVRKRAHQPAAAPQAAIIAKGRFVKYEPTRNVFALSSSGAIVTRAKERPCLITHVRPGNQAIVAPMTGAHGNDVTGWYRPLLMLANWWCPIKLLRENGTTLIEAPRDSDVSNRTPLEVTVEPHKDNKPSYIWIGDFGESVPITELSHAARQTMSDAQFQRWRNLHDTVFPRPTDDKGRSSYRDLYPTVPWGFLPVPPSPQ
ncbi:hypothetical protein SISSUDRAFT_1063981 [Sistotremastrum suecicum HHB10207 ss-3]|uniref:Uncharacterized protein n=1 Tax=Sistotremastrum suecicum HHB10207 ss-3 TaxID=1314776 RepID=A0A166B7M3_9AGAM|nr:hypothetical protein SISSUDRAFT_1063981 [Sistotremastrum suecicum HHB10207 ss-3]